MKLNGETPGPNVVDLYLPRKDNKVIHIQAAAVLDYSKFDLLVPPPKPPTKRMKGGVGVPDFEDKNHIAAVNAYGTHKTNWMVLESLKATPGLTWDTVDESNPQTWSYFDKELTEAGFCDFERQRILGAVLEANALNDKKIDEARETFLSAIQQPPAKE